MEYIEGKPLAGPLPTELGKWIFILSNRTGREEIWKSPASGGPAVQVTRDGAGNPRSIPGQPWLYYRRSDGVLVRMPQDGGVPESLGVGLWGRNWAPLEINCSSMTIRGCTHWKPATAACCARCRRPPVRTSFEHPVSPSLPMDAGCWSH